MVIFEILKNIVLAPLELIFEIIFSLAFKITGSEGLAIIILSLVVSTLVLPLYKRAEKIEAEQMAKEKELSHWIEHIKKNFKGDERYMMLDAYYRENHYSPLSQLRSTISILLQIPFFLTAYDLLGVRAADRLSGSSFLVFYDLGVPDGILSVGNITINLLPILMTLINVLTTYIYTKDQPTKTVLRSLALPLVFLVLLYNSPSALLLYWTMNNIYSLIKTIIIKNSVSGSTIKNNSKKAKTKQTGLIAKGIDSFFETKGNTSLFILSALFMSVLTGLLIPLAYLSASPEEFLDVMALQNPLHYLISSFFVAVGFFVAWPSVFYYLASKNIKHIIAAAMIGISVCSTVNYLFFGTDTGTINTSLVFDQAPSYPAMQMTLNAILVLLIFGACFFLYRFQKFFKIAFIAVILTTLTISAINAKKVHDAYIAVFNHIDDYREEESPQIRLSATGNNVMVIMLDRAVSGYIPYVLYEFPELAEKFDGFVYYPNCLAFGQNTLKTSSALFGGYDYTPERIDARADETLAEKHDESLKVLPQLFSDQGYTTTLMDLPFAGWSWNDDYSAFQDIDNCFTYHAKDYFTSDTESHVNVENRRNRNMFMYSLFRCSPLMLQTMIYDSGNYNSVTEDAYDIYDVLENYKVLENLEEMTQVSDMYPGCLFLMDNQTTHDVTNLSNYDPYNTVEFEEGYYITDGENELYLWDSYQAATYECLVASMLELGEYMDYLKANGVYDNTKIIIVSDHGTGVMLFDNLEFKEVSADWYNCLLMVKDFNSTGFETDYTFMTNADVPSIALEGIVNDPSNPYTGNPINTEPKNGDLYVGYSLTHDEKLWNPDLNQGNTFYYDEDCVWFKVINGNIFEESNWIKVNKPA